MNGRASSGNVAEFVYVTIEQSFGAVRRGRICYTPSGASPVAENGFSRCSRLRHASWHSLVKYGDDQIVVLAGMGLVAAAACGLPVPPLAVWLVIAGLVVLHGGYKLALARSYRRGVDRMGLGRDRGCALGEIEQPDCDERHDNRCCANHQHITHSVTPSRACVVVRTTGVSV